MRGLRSLKITVVSGRYLVNKLGPPQLFPCRGIAPDSASRPQFLAFPKPSRRTCRTAPASTPLPKRLSPVMTRVCAAFQGPEHCLAITPSLSKTAPSNYKERPREQANREFQRTVSFLVARIFESVST